MNQRQDSFFGIDEAAVEPFRLSAGFFAFVAAACLPAIVALSVFFGAWMVSGEVEAAERNSVAGSHAGSVEPWKKTLVGICPVH